MLHTPHAGVCARCLLGLQVRAQLSAHQNKRTLSKLGHIIDHNPGLHRPFKALPAFDPASKPWPPAWALCVAERPSINDSNEGAWRQRVPFCRPANTQGMARVRRPNSRQHGLVTTSLLWVRLWARNKGKDFRVQEQRPWFNKIC